MNSKPRLLTEISEKLTRRWTSRSRLRSYPYHFNAPIKFASDQWYVNERIVEIPFVHSQIAFSGLGKHILEFGCVKSDLALQLASLGYNVTGVDLREYVFTHPKLAVFRGDLLDFSVGHKFDYITAVSTLEHVGLGAYGEGAASDALYKVMRKLCSLLKAGGKIIATVPFGQEYGDRFLRSFTREQILSLCDVAVMDLVVERFFRRIDHKFWEPCTLEEAEKVSNARADRGPSGVNCVGCFVWTKKTEGLDGRP